MGDGTLITIGDQRQVRSRRADVGSLLYIPPWAGPRREGHRSKPPATSISLFPSQFTGYKGNGLPFFPIVLFPACNNIWGIDKATWICKYKIY